MNYGLYLSASGVLTNTYRQDVFANNLANVETPGFKPDIPTVRQRDPESIEDGLGMDVSQELLDKLGGGVLAGRQRINFKQGPLRASHQPLDVALLDKRQFFAVESINPETGQADVALTRDGRFTINGQNELVTQAGHRVLDASGQAIVVDATGQASIDEAGRLLINGVPTGRAIQVAEVDDLDALTKRGQGLFVFSGPGTARVLPEESVRVKPGHYEASGVDPIMAMMNVVAATKAITSNANMIRYHDQLLDRAVNTLGRVG
ncbi:MAG: flagellar hook basal-body protein [Phycisphaeraceae bacterium]